MAGTEQNQLRWAADIAHFSVSPFAHMQKLRAIFAFGLIAILVSWTIYDFVVKNEGILYFAAQPRRLFYVVAIALVGGLGSMVFARRSSQVRRTSSAIAAGASAVALTTFTAFFALRAISLWSEIRNASMSTLTVGLVVLFAGLAGSLWFQFLRILKKSGDERSEG